jgi:hypothetical protein
MRILTLFLAGSAILLTLSSCASQGTAQEQDVKPKPAARSYVPSIDVDNGQDVTGAQDSTETLRPDTRPLTGVQNATLGSPDLRHSYWDAGFQYGNTIQSISLSQTKTSDWYSNNYLLGNLSLWKQGRFSHLALNYSGGGSFSTNNAQGNAQFHQFGFSESFKWQRWELQFLDQFAYLPESQFGFGGTTNLNVPGVGGALAPPLPGLGINYVPNQDILTSFGNRYSNAFATQVNYLLSARGSITVAGSYGILRFINPGNIDSDSVTGNLGYNYSLTRNDTIGVMYRFTGYHFSAFSQAIGDHVINLAYGRKITGRLALQLFGGPEVTTFRVPVNNMTERVSGSAGAALSYRLSAGGISLNYNHGVSGGGGVLVGSLSDQLGISADRQLGRLWHARANFGYARNYSITTAAQQFPGYNSWYLGAGLDHPVGRNANFSVGYTSWLQTSNQPGTTNTTQHQVSFEFRWHTKPIVIE